MRPASKNKRKKLVSRLLVTVVFLLLCTLAGFAAFAFTEPLVHIGNMAIAKLRTLSPRFSRRKFVPPSTSRDISVLGISTQGGSAVSFGRALDTNFNISFAGFVQGNSLISTTTTGAPLSVASPTKVTNFNADFLDGYDWTGNIAFSGNPTFSNTIQMTGTGKQLLLSGGASDPAALGAGSLYYNTANNTVRYYNGTSWGDIGTGNVTITSGWTDAGSYLYPASGEYLGNNNSGGGNKVAGLYITSSGSLALGNDNNTSFSFSGSTLGLTIGGNNFNVDGDTFFVSGSGNNVGIGTSSPARALDVAASGGIRLAPSSLPSSPGSGDIAIDSSDSNNLKWYNGLGWVTVGSSASNYWQQNSGALSPANTSNDLLLGSAATSSALIRLAGVSGGNSFFNTGGYVGIGTSAPARPLHVAASGGVRFAPTALPSSPAAGDIAIDSSDSNNLKWYNGSGWVTVGSSASNYWQENAGALSPTNITDDLLLGAIATSSALIRLAGISGESSFFNTGGNVGIGTAVPVANFNLVSNATSGDIGLVTGNSLTTGTLWGLTSTSTSLSSGRLLTVDWSPSPSTTASGDLVRINIGPQGDITGNLFNITNSGSTLFSVSETQITSALPHQFTAAGDVTMAYDLLFTNQTASYIKSNAPLYIQAGEPFESNSLSLQTFNSGNILLDPASGSVAIGTNLSPIAKLEVNGFQVGKALVVFNETGDQSILTASASGTTRFVVENNGNVGIGTTAPVARLHVSDSQSATVSAMIENTDTSNTSDGLAVKLGCTTTTCDTGNYFVSFMDGGGRIFGKIQGTGTSAVNYSSTGIDFAEYFRKESGVAFEEGDVIASGPMGATKTATPYDSRLLGVFSTAPAFSGGSEGPDKVLVALVGQIPVKISTSSQAIQPGDSLTSSPEAGKAMKATQTGTILGHALESWDPANPKWAVMMKIGVTWTDPTITFDANGNLVRSGGSEFGTLTDSRVLPRAFPQENPQGDPFLGAPLPASPAADLTKSSGVDILGLTIPLEATGSSTNVPITKPITIESTFTVLGETTLGQTTIAGSLLVDGNLSFSTFGIATVTDTLFLQKNRLADVDIGDGTLVVTKEGNLFAKGNLGVVGNISATGVLGAQKLTISPSLEATSTSTLTDASIGKGIIPLGQDEATMYTTSVSDASLVFVTGTSKGAKSIYVKEINNGSFTVSIDQTAQADETFNWWAVN